MKNLLIILTLVVAGTVGAGAYLSYVGDGPDPIAIWLTGQEPFSSNAESNSPSEDSIGVVATAAAQGIAQTANANSPSNADTDESGPVRFSSPIDCVIGRSCVIQNFVDMASNDGYQDYTCGPLSYDEHTGTDFRLPSHKEMEAGVGVLAAAPGTVLRVRDGMPDVNFRLVGREAVNDRGLGNVVLIQHEDGFLTVYAHLKRGSVSVQQGQKVARGDRLGEVGLSGLTEFPHLHFEVQRNRSVIDPFTGRSQEDGCGIVQTPLWTEAALEELRYIPTLVVRMGFADKALNRAAVEYGLLIGDEVMSRQSENMLLHVYLAGVRAGDVARFQILEPGGAKIVDTERILDKDAAVHLIRGGATQRTQAWQPGLYQGIFTLTREENGAPVEVIRGESKVSVQ